VSGVDLRSVVENHEVVVGHEVTVGDSIVYKFGVSRFFYLSGSFNDAETRLLVSICLQQSCHAEWNTGTSRLIPKVNGHVITTRSS